MIGLAVLTFFFLSFLYFLFLLLLSGIGRSWLSASQPWFSVLLPGLLPPFFFSCVSSYASMLLFVSMVNLESIT